MTENEKICAMFYEGLIEREDVPPSCWHKRKRRKPKVPSWKAAVKEANALGKDVIMTRAPDGTVTFESVSRRPETLNGNDTATAEDELAQWRKRKRDAHSG
jgi:hypothetical protein